MAPSAAAVITHRAALAGGGGIVDIAGNPTPNSSYARRPE
jgi:hypothetical protein